MNNLSFQDLQKIERKEDTITINGQTQTVRLLTVSEIEKYRSIINEGFGTVQTNVRGGTSQNQANINVQRMDNAQRKAEHYIIRRTFIEDGQEVITEQDIDTLYDVYPLLVAELKRINDIIETNDESVIQALSNEKESTLKKH